MLQEAPRGFQCSFPAFGVARAAGQPAPPGLGGIALASGSGGESHRESEDRGEANIPQLTVVLSITHDSLALDTGVIVDWQCLQERLSLIQTHATVPEPAHIATLKRAVLLPGWNDDWAIFEHERLNQRRLAALETLAERFLALGDGRHCAEAAGAAATIEPLRESAHRLLIQGHLSTGDYYPALRAFELFRTRLSDELGLQPSPQMQQLIANITIAQGPLHSAAEWRTMARWRRM
jgi:hypothetical protein